MKRSGSPMLLFESLDLRPLHSILWKGLHVGGAGRPVKYDPECDLRDLMLRQLEQIPHAKDLVKRLRRYREMRSACGYGEKVPTEAHFSQMKKRIGVKGFSAVEKWLRHEALRLRKSQHCPQWAWSKQLAWTELISQLGAVETHMTQAEDLATQTLGLGWERKASSWATNRCSSSTSKASH